MTGADIATIALGSTAIAGAVSGALVWVHRRGGDERELSVELKANTAATRDLTAKFERLTDRYEARHEALSGRVDDHEVRIAVLETRRGRLGERTRAGSCPEPGGLSVVPGYRCLVFRDGRRRGDVPQGLSQFPGHFHASPSTPGCRAGPGSCTGSPPWKPGRRRHAPRRSR